MHAETDKSFIGTLCCLYLNYSVVLLHCYTSINNQWSRVCHAGPRAWNSLPPAVRSSATYNTFKKDLKSYLFELSFSLWQLCILTMYSALVVVDTAYCALQIVRLTLHYIMYCCIELQLWLVYVKDWQWSRWTLCGTVWQWTHSAQMIASTGSWRRPRAKSITRSALTHCGISSSTRHCIYYLPLLFLCGWQLAVERIRDVLWQCAV